MTKADELYLKKFMAARAHKDIAKVETTNIGNKQYTGWDEPDSEDGNGPRDGGTNIETDINYRLLLERNKELKPEKITYKSPSGEKVTITNQIFGEN